MILTKGKITYFLIPVKVTALKNPARTKVANEKILPKVLFKTNPVGGTE